MPTASTILAIDAGSTESAFLVLTGESIGRFGKLPNEEFLLVLAQILPEVDVVACEFPWPRGQATSYEEFLMVEWVGRFRQVIDEAGVKFEKIFRVREKVCVCGSPTAKDANIRTALLDIFGPQGSKKNPGPTFGISADVWSALAVAYTFREEGESETAMLAKRDANRAEKKAKKAAKLERAQDSHAQAQ
jgi:hypothetical protein